MVLLRTQLFINKIMLRILFLVFLLFSTNLESQSSKSQKDWFESGQKFLKKKKFEIAASKFYLAEKYGPDTEIKKLARLKIDSILPLAKKKIINKMKGDWKLKEFHGNFHPLKFSDYIKITDKEIVFYKKDSFGKKVILRKEQIRFLPYDSIKSIFSARKFVFKNTEIWEFWLSHKKNKKKLYPEIDTDSLGRGQSRVSTIMINKKERKKALKKETQTFYVKKKKYFFI